MRGNSGWVLFVWCLAFGLLILNAAVSVRNIEVLTANERAVSHSRDISRALRDLLTSIIDAETGQRGFQITGDDEYLTPFRAAESARPELQHRLIDLVAVESYHRDRLDVLLPLIDKKYDEMRKAIEQRKTDRDAAREIIKKGRGKELMDRIRVIAAEMERHEEDNLSARSEIARQHHQSAMFTAVAGGLLTVIMVGMAFILVRNELRRRHRAEQTVRASEHRFRTLTEAIPQMVWNADGKGRITYVNRRWLEFTGLTEADLDVRWWNQIALPDDAKRMGAAWQTANSSEPKPFEEEVRVRSVVDGSYRWFLATVIPLLKGDGRFDQWIGALSSIDDQKRQNEILASLVKKRTVELETAISHLREEVVERTRAEARVTAAAAELKRSNEDLEKFAYVASHDLQEPLRKIQSFGDLLTKNHRDQLGTTAVDYVNRMRSAATRMRTLIDDLLSFSQVTTKGNPFARLDLNEIVADVLSDLETSIAQFSGQVDVAALPQIEADPMQMRQLFQNLIGNALKFHKPDVPPRVTIRAERWETLSADADPLPPTGYGYRIEVADNGIGFDQSYADRVFEVFQRLHSRAEYEGTGIGLAICRKIVQRHHGSIQVRSRVGEGTTMLIDLPAKGQEIDT